jgi:DNA-binding beta-propeller fold protein YncE
MMKRRNFLQLTVAAGTTSTPVLAQHGGSDSCLPATIPSRPSNPVEILYKAPYGQPNGLAVTRNPGEMWVLNKGINHKVSLIRIRDGSVIREITADISGPSGLVVDDDEVMWISNTHGVMLVAVNPADGKTIAKYIVPGSCRVYEKKGDPPWRASTMMLAYPDENRDLGDPHKHNEGNDTGSGLGPGRLRLDTAYEFSATGPFGIIARGNTLFYATDTSRAIYAIDKKSWQVESVWPVPGNRPHGLAWQDARKESFWNVDVNLNVFFHFDATTGKVSEAIALPEGAPLAHGCQIVDGYMYFCDDFGWICRFKM